MNKTSIRICKKSEDISKKNVFEYLVIKIKELLLYGTTELLDCLQDLRESCYFVLLLFSLSLPFGFFLCI